METSDQPCVSGRRESTDTDTESASGPNPERQSPEPPGSPESTSETVAPDSSYEANFEDNPEFGLYAHQDDGDAEYDVVLIHGIRDSCATVWTFEDKSNWVNMYILKSQKIRILEFRYGLNDQAPIYSEGIQAVANKLLEDLVKVRRNQPPRRLIFVARDIGGTIAQMALLMSMSKPDPYNSVSNATNLMIFYNCPHRIGQTPQAHDTMIKLLTLPYPADLPSLTALSIKALRLAEQVDSVSRGAVNALLWQYMSVYNIVSAPPAEEKAGPASTKEDHQNDSKSTQGNRMHNKTVGYLLENNSGTMGQAFEHKMTTNATHIGLGQCEEVTADIAALRLALEKHLPIIAQHCPINANAGIRMWSSLLPLCPPVRATPTQHNIEESSDDPFWHWFKERQEYKFWCNKRDADTRVLHVHGSSLVDVWSDTIYHGARGRGGNLDSPTIYFQFSRNDVRFNNVRGMMSYIVSQLSRHLLLEGRLDILEDLAHGWGPTSPLSTVELFQLFLIMRRYSEAEAVFFIISNIDYCHDDVIEYLYKLQDIGKATEIRCRILVTSDTKSDCMSRVQGCGTINVDLFANKEAYFTKGLLAQTQRLFEELAISDADIKALVVETIDEYRSDHQLKRTVLAWLASFQGRPCYMLEAIETLRNLSKPPSPTSVSVAIRASLTKSLQVIEKEVFTIVKTAFHPLTVDQIAWILISNDSVNPVGDPGLKQRDAVRKIKECLPGLYELRHGEVHLCHDHWKLEHTDADRDENARHAMMTRRCLNYLLHHRMLSDATRLGGSGENDNLHLDFCGNSLTVYSTKFLSQHYEKAGDSRPLQELFNFFQDKSTRMAWYNTHMKLENHTNPSGNYLRALPVVARAGLSDLAAMILESERHEEHFETDVELALIEAASSGHTSVVHLLLPEINAKVSILKIAVHGAAAHGSLEPLYSLVKHCVLIENFEWPEDILHRVSWLGLSDVVEELLKAGVPANLEQELLAYTGHTPLTLCMTGRHERTAKLLIQKGHADFNKKTSVGRSVLIQAARYSSLDTLAYLLQCGAGDDKKTLFDALEDACWDAAFGALRQFLAKVSIEDWESNVKKRGDSLRTAVLGGYLNCVKALVTHGIDVSVVTEHSFLLMAVSNERLEIARFLLDQGADPDFSSENIQLPLLGAINSGDFEMVKLLLDKGADIERLDQRKGNLKTALCNASASARTDILDLLLDRGADVNHFVAGSYSPLFAAVWFNRRENVKRLLDRGADVNAAISDPVDWAPVNATYDDVHMLKTLIDAGADINHNSVDGTVLLLASRWGHQASVELLLSECGKILDLDKGDQDRSGEEYDDSNPLSEACNNNHEGIVRLLLEAGADAQRAVCHGSFPLGICARNSSERALRVLLEYSSRINLNQQEDEGNTALHQITATSPLTIVKLLVNAGASLDIPNKQGRTPLWVAITANNVDVSRYLSIKIARIGSGLLHRAAFQGNLDLVQMLVERGADVNEPDPKTGATPLYTHLTGEAPRLSIVRYLVETAKADVNRESTGSKYPIIEACKEYDRDIVSFLVEAGASLIVQDHVGRSPMHVVYYSYRHDYDDIQFLFKHGADIKARDKLGRTALHYAAALADEDDVEKLILLSGIDVNARDNDGWTPLMWACMQRKSFNCDYIAEILIRHGADIWIRGRVEDEQWSPLKLAKFQGGYGSWVLERLEPEDKSRPRDPNSENDAEYWDENFHKSRKGTDWGDRTCDGCYCGKRGVRWVCQSEHPSSFNLCFRCYPHRDILDPGHTHFDPVGETFDPESEDEESSEHSEPNKTTDESERSDDSA